MKIICIGITKTVSESLLSLWEDVTEEDVMQMKEHSGKNKVFTVTVKGSESPTTLGQPQGYLPYTFCNKAFGKGYLKQIYPYV